MHRESRPHAHTFLETLKIQEVLWTQLKANTSYSFEILLPLKAKEHSEQGSWYVVYVVQAIEDAQYPAIRAQDYLILQLPVKTWGRALRSIELSLKKQWTGDLANHTVCVTFKKVRKTLIELSYCERKIISDEQKKKAEEYYALHG